MRFADCGSQNGLGGKLDVTFTFVDMSTTIHRIAYSIL